MAQKVCNYTLPQEAYEAIKTLAAESGMGQSEIVRMILMPALNGATVKLKAGEAPLRDLAVSLADFNADWKSFGVPRRPGTKPNITRSVVTERSPHPPGTPSQAPPTPTPTVESVPTMFGDPNAPPRKRNGVTNLDPPGRLPHGISQVGLDGPDGPKRYCNLQDVLQAFTVTREQILPFLIPEDDIRLHDKKEWVRSAGVHAAANLSLDPEAGIIKTWWDSLAMKV